MTNDISQFLTAQNTILNLNTGCKRGALKELSLYAAKQLDLDPDHLLQILLEREQLGTTGIGRGVAVPHARVDVKELTGFLAKLSKPVDFDAIDDEPVDLVFLLLAPEQADADHLKALSRIARLVSSDNVQLAMRKAQDTQHLYDVAIGKVDAQAA